MDNNKIIKNTKLKEKKIDDEKTTPLKRATSTLIVSKMHPRFINLG